MVQLADSDIRTREVLGWQGLHVFHAPLSSCSQKLRIVLSLKSLEWTSHEVNLAANENLTPWYLGINPRGLVPALIDDGAVHIESNDIILHLDRKVPEPRLVPGGMEDRIADLLRHEDDLHHDLRNLSFRFLFPHSGQPKSEEDLARYAQAGTGTVGGKPDPALQREIDYWKNFTQGAVADEAVRASAKRFREAFAALDAQLAQTGYAYGASYSVVDVAWAVYAQRLALAGYSLSELHPHVAAWLEAQLARPELARELELPAPLAPFLNAHRQSLEARGQSLRQVCFPELAQ